MKDDKGFKGLTDIQKDIRRFLIPVLRRASMRFKLKDKTYPRTTAKQNARIERGVYKCAACGCGFRESETIVDHIDPIVPLTGDTYSWDDFINGMFVTADKLQILCINCNEIKTLTEDNLRTAHREVKKQDAIVQKAAAKVLKKHKKVFEKLAEDEKKELAKKKEIE